jgi:hypothetical protein
MSAFVPKADSCSAAINAALGQVLPDFCQQLTWAEGFRNVITAARFARCSNVLRSTHRHKWAGTTVVFGRYQ